MFGRRSRKVLEKHLEDAHIENAEIKGSVFWGIAEALMAEVKNRVATANPDAAVEEAVRKQRSILYRQHLGAIAAQKAAERIEQEREAIRRQAELDAEELAQQELERFRLEEADDYLREATEKAQAQHSDLVHKEKNKLAAQALERAYEEARAQAAKEFSEEDLRSHPEHNKWRAKQIRAETKRTRILNLADLMEGDVLEVDFVKKGEGNEPHTNGYGFDNDIAVRRTKFRLKDPKEGVAIVESDQKLRGSWVDEIYPMTEVRLFCLEPTNREDEIAAINKAAPLTITEMDGDLRSDPEFEVWRVDLNDYRVLS